MKNSVVTLEKGWHLKEREPVGKRAKLVLVNADQMDALKDCPRFMTVKQVSELIDFSAGIISEWCRVRRIEANKIGNEWRISKQALAKFLVTDSQR